MCKSASLFMFVFFQAEDGIQDTSVTGVQTCALPIFKGSPEIYLVIGKAAHGQLAVFGSEPGEPSYSPLWDETDLTWKAGATPVLIKSDTQINQDRKSVV